MFKKVLKIIGIVLAAAAAGFIGLVAYTYFHPEFGAVKEPGAAEEPKTETKTQKSSQKTQAVKPAEKPSLPSTSEPVIVSVEFPKQIPLNQKTTATVSFKDREGDVAKLIFQDLNSGATNEIDYSSKAVGKTSGFLTFTQTLTAAKISFRRLILVDKAGHQSAPYILTYKAGDTSAYDRFDAEVLMNRPVERRKKIYFFILSNAEFKTELANGSSFASEADAIGTASPAVAKMFETSVLPQINGLWDQCGVAFDLGMVKAVRPEKVNLPDGGTLVSLFGIFLDGEPFVITGDNSADAPTGISLIKTALPAFGIPDGDIAIFIEGPKFVDVETGNENVAGHAIKNLALVSWRYIHFQNETRGEIIIPKTIMKTLAHEIGHSLGLKHPDQEKAISADKFSDFNLMWQGKQKPGKIGPELIPEQCGIVAGIETLSFDNGG